MEEREKERLKIVEKKRIGEEDEKKGKRREIQKLSRKGGGGKS